MIKKKSLVALAVLVLIASSAFLVAAQRQEGYIIKLVEEKGPSGANYVVKEITKTQVFPMTTQGPYSIDFKDGVGNILNSFSFSEPEPTIIEGDPDLGIPSIIGFPGEKEVVLIIPSLPDSLYASILGPGRVAGSAEPIVDLGSLQDRCGDGTCQRGYENYFSCDVDCPSGSYDDYCDAIPDGTCDRDCFSQVGTVVDPDCVVPDLGVCDQNSTECWSDAIFGCVLDATFNEVWIWEENCDVSCVEDGNKASCGELEELKVSPVCRTNNDCVVNNEQWYCGCSGSCFKEQAGGQCCFDGA